MALLVAVVFGYGNANSQRFIPGQFAEGLCLFKMGKYGYIDRSGNIVIPPKFIDVHNFKDGTAVVLNQDGYGVIDRSGKVVVESKYAYMVNLGYKQFACFNNGSWSVLDSKSGAVVGEYDQVIGFSSEICLVSKQNTLCFMARDGKVLREFPKARKARAVRGGFAVVSSTGFSMLFDQAGVLLFRSLTGRVVGYSDGIVCLEDNQSYSYLDLDKKVVAKGFDYGAPFSEGLASVGVGGRFYYIDTSGRKVTRDYTGVGEFKEGLSWVRVKSGKCGYINKDDTMVIAPEYSLCGVFSDGLAGVEHHDSAGNRKIVYLNSNGDRVVLLPDGSKENDAVQPVKGLD